MNTKLPAIEDIVLTPRHLTKAANCRGKSREFFAKYGYDWSLFLKQGIPVPVIAESKDGRVSSALAICLMEAGYSKKEASKQARELLS